MYERYEKDGELPEGVILPVSSVLREIREQVFALFAEHGTGALGPIHYAMAQGVDYLNLDLLRLEYLQTARAKKESLPN